MAKNKTNINTLEDEKKLSEIKSALVNSALGGIRQEETIVSKSSSGVPVARKKISSSKPDPQAALAYARLVNHGKDCGPAVRNKFLQVSDDGRILLSTSKLAEIMSVSTKTVGVWERQGCPKEKRGWYDIAAVIRWRGREIGVQGGTDGMAAKLEADTRLKQARAAMAEQELKVKSGELIPVILVEERMAEIMVDLKNSMLTIGNNVMTELYSQFPDLSQQVRRLIDGYIREALKRVAENGGKITRQPAPTAIGRPRKSNKKSI